LLSLPLLLRAWTAGQEVLCIGIGLRHPNHLPVPFKRLSLLTLPFSAGRQFLRKENAPSASTDDGTRWSACFGESATFVMRIPFRPLPFSFLESHASHNPPSFIAPPPFFRPVCGKALGLSKGYPPPLYLERPVSPPTLTPRRVPGSSQSAPHSIGEGQPFPFRERTRPPGFYKDPSRPRSPPPPLSIVAFQ